MIIQGSDLLLALGAPQASGEYQNETQGAASFAQFLTQDPELPESLLAFLAPSSQSPAPVLPLQLRLGSLSLEPSMSGLVDAGEAAQEEQEHRALKEILDALQDLFPAMIPDVLVPLPNAPTATAEGVPTLAISQEGGKIALGFLQGASIQAAPLDGIEGEEVAPHARDLATVPLSIAAAEDAESLPQGGGQASAAGDVRQLLAQQGISTAAAAADPSMPEPQAADEVSSRQQAKAAGAALAAPESRTSGEVSNSPNPQSALPNPQVPEPQITAHTTGAHLTVSTPDNEVALGNAVRENLHSEADAPAATPSPAHQVAEGTSGQALLPEDVSRFSSHATEVRLSAEQPSEAALLRQAQPPEQQAAGALRYFPLPRSTVLLQLDPPELGTLFVQVRQVDEQLTASFWAESSEVRSLLQAHFPNLNQVLSQQGLSAQQISLQLATGDGFAEQFGQFSQQHSAAHTFSHGNRGETSGGRRRDLDNPAERRRPGNGRVDITI